MIIFLILLLLLLVLTLWLFMIMPSCSITKRTAARELLGYDYAHRGLHDKEKGIP